MSGSRVATTFTCTCKKFEDRCFRRADMAGGQCFPCATGNCGLGGTHGYGALHPEEIVEREVVPTDLRNALEHLGGYLSGCDLQDRRPLNEESERVAIPVRMLIALRDAWFAYRAGGGK